jgi:hypothetical protein
MYSPMLKPRHPANRAIGRGDPVLWAIKPLPLALPATLSGLCAAPDCAPRLCSGLRRCSLRPRLNSRRPIRALMLRCLSQSAPGWIHVVASGVDNQLRRVGGIGQRPISHRSAEGSLGRRWETALRAVSPTLPACTSVSRTRVLPRRSRGRTQRALHAAAYTASPRVRLHGTLN